MQIYDKENRNPLDFQGRTTDGGVNLQLQYEKKSIACVVVKNGPVNGSRNNIVDALKRSFEEKKKIRIPTDSEDITLTKSVPKNQ